MASSGGCWWGAEWGIDLTFSAPKSVSVEWALGNQDTRQAIEDAHTAAVSQAVGHIRDVLPTVRRRYSGAVVEECAQDVLAAEYRHTTARSVVEGEMPDPQLHSHVVISGVVRDDGRFVAVASRPLFRSAREAGAFYRSALAQELGDRGFQIERGTGRHGRYFEIADMPHAMLEAFSARSREVARAAERFRAKWGRAPERGELRQLKQENRRSKRLVHHGDLDRAWQQTAARFNDTKPERPEHEDRSGLALQDRVENALTQRAATFEMRELRAVVLEQSVGELSPLEAIELVAAGRSADTINHYRRVVRGIFGTHPSSPALAWTWMAHKLESEGRLQFYTPEQVRKLLAEAYSDMDVAIYTLATQAGPRLSEIRGLKVEHVDFEVGVVRFEDGYTKHGGYAGNKGRRTRSVPMSADVRAALAPFCEGKPDERLVFEHERWPGEPICGSDLYRRFLNAAKRAGLARITLHELRHTFGTQAIRTFKIHEVQQMMGHRHITTTERYLHYAPDPDGASKLTELWASSAGKSAGDQANVISLRRAA